MGHIDADGADAEEQQRADENLRQNQAEPAAFKRHTPEPVHRKGVHQIKADHPEKKEPEKETQIERQGGEGGDPAMGKVKHLPERIFAHPGRTLRAVVLHHRGREAGPRHQPAEKSTPFPHFVQGIDHDAVNQTEIAHLTGRLHPGEPAENPVKGGGSDPLEPGVLFPTFSPGIDDFCPLLPGLDHRGNELGGILQITVHRNHGAPGRHTITARQRRRVAEVPAKGEAADAGILPTDFFHFPPRAVPAPVIDKDQPGPNPASLQLPENRPEPLPKQRQDRLLVETGGDHRDLRAGGSFFSVQRKRILSRRTAPQSIRISRAGPA